MPWRTAFSLVEMIVAMGVLVLMLVLAGQVFNLTIQSTGQATALVEMNQSIRSFERRIRDDLAHVYPGESLIAVQGNPVHAYWTPEGREADADTVPANGYAHERDPEHEAFNLATLEPVLDNQARPILTLPRADILMMFTSRRSRSYVAPEVRSNMQQVVYGHAIPGEYVTNPGGPGSFEFEQVTSGKPVFPEPTLATAPETAPLPASSWHLARREVQLISSNVPSLIEQGPEPPLALDWCVGGVFGCPGGAQGAGPGLEHPDLLSGEIDVVVNFDYASLVQRVDLNLLSSGPVSNAGSSVAGWMLPWIFGKDKDVEPKNPLARSKLDTTPPARYANRLGHYMLPNCASFKVEWSLNPKSDFVAGRLAGVREILWIDPGHTNDPIGRTDPGADDPLFLIQQAMEKADEEGKTALQDQLESVLTLPDLHPDGSRYSLSQRFRGPTYEDPVTSEPGWPALTSLLGASGSKRANTHVFHATRPVNDPLEGGAASAVFGPDELENVVPDSIYPSAVRITIDLFDPQRRLGRPMRHVIVATVGR